MAITNFISTVWSETLATSLDSRYVAVANCNRAYEGDIREMIHKIVPTYKMPEGQ